MYRVELTEALFPARHDEPLHPRTIGAMLRDQATLLADAAALTEVKEDGAIGRRWSYATLLADCERLARALATRHERGARIAICASNVPEWVLVEMAAAMAGLTLVTANPALDAENLCYLLEQSAAEAIYATVGAEGSDMALAVAAACERLPRVRRFALNDAAALFEGESSGELRQTVPEDIAQTQYTSGTTGFPKGALLSQHGMLQNGFDTFARLGVRAGDRVISMIPMFHTSGCGTGVLGGLANGAELFLVPNFNPEAIVRVIDREKIDVLIGIPTMFVALIDAAQRTGRNLGSVCKLMSGRSTIAPDQIGKAREAFGAPIQIIYGQTEASPTITMSWSDDADEDLTGTIGQPLPHIDLAIRDPASGRVCAIGDQGEICVRGYNVMRGYNANPDATAEAIDADGWLHTGDAGTMDSRGYVSLTGRIKDMIVSAGETIFPAEIEHALLGHPEVLEAAVVGIPDPQWGERVACFLRARGTERPDAAALRRYARERLPAQKIPAYWIWVDRWPQTGSGKIQKFELREAFLRGEHTVEPIV